MCFALVTRFKEVSFIHDWYIVSFLCAMYLRFRSFNCKCVRMNEHFSDNGLESYRQSLRPKRKVDESLGQDSGVSSQIQEQRRAVV